MPYLGQDDSRLKFPPVMQLHATRLLHTRQTFPR